MAKKILLGLTTITPGEWREKVKEIDELGIKELSLFPTCLNAGERKELYRLLEKTGLEKIPHVHLREQDFSQTEIDYLVDTYEVEVFNIHSTADTPVFIKKFFPIRKKVFIENIHYIPDNFEELLKQTGGLCLDLSHWEGQGNLKKAEGYDIMPSLVKKYKIGVNHISAVKPEKSVYHELSTGKNSYNYDSHWLGDLSELGYVKKYKNYLADIISIELENSLKRQTEVKTYLAKILDL